jgi:ribosomal protein S27E
MSNRLECPSCGQTLTVSDAAPSQLTCPKCLAKLINPGAMSGGAARAVIPVEVETSRDNVAAKIGMAVFLVLLACGALIGLAQSGSRAIAEPALHAVVLAVLAGVVWAGIRMVRSRAPVGESMETLREPSPVARDVSTPPPLPPMAGGVLDYQDREHFRQQRFSVGAFIGGFFAALVVCAAGMVTLAFTYDPVPKTMHPLVVLGLGAGVGAFIFFCATIGKRRPTWRGFGRGATIGLVLGMLALGPCALCYMAV